MNYFTGEKRTTDKKSWLCSTSTREIHRNDDGFVTWNFQDTEIGFSQCSKPKLLRFKALCEVQKPEVPLNFQNKKINNMQWKVLLGPSWNPIRSEVSHPHKSPFKVTNLEFKDPHDCGSQWGCTHRSNGIILLAWFLWGNSQSKEKHVHKY